MKESSTWISHCGKFTHQWLKNDFKVTLNWFLAIISDGLDDPVFVKSFLGETLPQWPEKSAEAKELLDEGSFEMSPARLVEQPPLSKCPDDLKELMSNVCHVLWQTRNQKLFDDAAASIEAMDVAYEQIFAQVASGSRH